MANIEDLRDRSVSSGTLKSDDLIPKFLGVLKTYGKDKYDAYIKENPEVEDWKNLDDETMGWVVDELTDLLNEIAPDGCYFGASEGDGADFGFWSMSNESKKSEATLDAYRKRAKELGGKLRIRSNSLGKFGEIMLGDTGYSTMGSVFTKELLDKYKPLFDLHREMANDPDIKAMGIIINESKKSEVSSLAAFDIEDVVGKKLGWTWDDDKSCLVDKDGTEVDWDESDSITIDPVEDEDGNVLTQVNMWGDGTVEFQDENGESVNWTEFDDATVKKVVAVLGGKSEAKKVPVQEDGNKDIFTLDLTRIDADGDEEGLDDMQAAQTFYDEDDAIKAAKELADSYKDDDGVVQVIVMAGEQEKPNGDIVGDSFDIYWASSNDKQTTADYRKKARYAAFDNKMDYYAKGGKSEAYEDIWRGADVMTHTEACEQLDYVKEIEDDIISEYGEDYYEDPDAVDDYNQRIQDYIDSCFEQDFVSINGEKIPLGISRDPKLLIVLTDDTDYENEAVELVKKLANGELTGSSDDGDYVAIMDGVHGSPHFDIYSEGGKSEGNDDDKGCKGKDCKDDKTKKNEADATFKVGDFVNYDAESDGKDVYDSFIPCEVVDVNDDGTLGLCVYGSYVNEEGLGENASASCCSKLDHYAGMVDANHYYMGGKYNAYKGGWEILITDKELNPKVYEFIGTIDDLSEVLDIDDFYGGENFVFDEDLKDEVANNTGWDVETTTFADMTGDVGESKQTEAKKKYYGYGKDDAIDKEDTDFMWQVAYDWFEDRLPEKLKRWASTAVISVIDKDSRAYEEIVTMDDYHAYLQKYGPFVIKDIKANDESKQTEGLPPKKLGNRLYRSRADLINKMKTLDAVEITTPAQFNDIHSKQWLHTAGYAMDINGNLVGQTYFGDKDGKWYYATTKTFQGDYLPECKQTEGLWDDWDGKDPKIGTYYTEDELAILKDVFKKYVQEVSGIHYSVPADYTISYDIAEDPLNHFNAVVKAVGKNGKPIYLCNLAGEVLWEPNTPKQFSYYVGQVDSKTGEEKKGKYVIPPRSFFLDDDYYANAKADTRIPLNPSDWDTIDNYFKKFFKQSSESNKSESLTLKQKELKDMARFGQAEDITTISDEEAKALRKKGIETIGVSRGTYGMNGALLRDNEGKKYVITARSSNLFYFV